jgi:hypothetical protein
MNRTVYKLLTGYLLRSVWLYGFLGLVQFCMTELYWVRGFARVTVPAALLGLWGIATAINAQSPVWRSLPLSARDASVFRWWAIAGAPAVFLTLVDLITWASQLTASRLPAPTVDALLQSVLMAWAAIGILAALPAVGARIRGRFAVRTSSVLVAAYALWLVYGPPTYSASPTASMAFAAIGLGSLIFSGARAARGKLWRWPDVLNRSAKPQRQSALWSVGPRFGVNAILIPLLKRSAGFAVMAAGSIVLLYRIFPGAGAILFWSYFIAISTTGFLLTFQIRSAIQTLRILPLSAKQLAGMLQFYGALPGFATLALALLANSTLLHVKLDPAEFATFALIIIASQALPIRPAVPRATGPVFRKWLPLFQRTFLPAYLGFVVLNFGGMFSQWWWFRWPLIGAGIVMCFVGYYALVMQLRSGIRPSSNETFFSAR